MRSCRRPTAARRGTPRASSGRKASTTRRSSWPRTSPALTTSSSVIENDWGPGRQRKNTRNGHLQQRYTNNQPTQVEVFNNPVIQPAYVAYDVGIFVQDSWTIKRLTINPGLRVQWVETGMYESSMAAGRFAPARFIEEEKGLIDFGADYSPRFSAVYDLFGDGRTALKTSWSKYYRNYDGDIAANAYGRAGERSELRTWLDRNLITGTNTPSGRRGYCALASASFRPIATASRRTTRSASARAAARLPTRTGPIASR